MRGDWAQRDFDLSMHHKRKRQSVNQAKTGEGTPMLYGNRDEGKPSQPL